MRQLLPELIDPVDPAEVYADLPVVEGRPSVRLNMIASVDGGTSWKGVSGSLGGPADKRLFGVIRSLADVVLVGAGTMREEHYGPSSIPIAVVTRSANLDWQSPFFTEAKARPIVLTVEDAPQENLEHAAEVADVVYAGTGGVDLHSAVNELGERGFRRVVAEGGPTLNSQLTRAGVLDELCLTVSPKLLVGDAKRILAGAELAEPVKLQLRSVLEDENYLFLRYRCLS